MPLKALRDAPWFHRSAGALVAGYLRLVWRSNRFVLEPPDLYERLNGDLPVIATLWHGKHYMSPLLRRPEHRVKGLVSSHRDAQIIAEVIKRLGGEVIRGSGAHEGRFDRKGGVRAFVAMRDALQQGFNMVLTADVPKVARVAGLGIVMLARKSGRPIYPFGMATSRRIVLNNWDHSVINLPFGRGAIVLGEVVRVPPDADEHVLEACRRQLEASLNAATARAHELVGTRVEEGKEARA